MTRIRNRQRQERKEVSSTPTGFLLSEDMRVAVSSKMGLFQNGKGLLERAWVKILWGLGESVVLYWES
jgi:hypothetical protein